MAVKQLLLLAVSGFRGQLVFSIRWILVVVSESLSSATIIQLA